MILVLKAWGGVTVVKSMQNIQHGINRSLPDTH